MITFNEFERAAWEEKASRYDGSWGTVTRQTIPAMLSRLKLQPRQRLLDCGSGTGHLVAEAVKSGAEVIGCDASQEMLSLARTNYPALRFVFADAESLPFEAASFDAVSLNFLLLHVGDPERVIRECTRVLAPGGVLAYTLWLPPERSAGLSIIFDAIAAFADRTVLPPAPDPFLLARPESTRELLSSLGLSDLFFEELPTTWEVATGEEFFQAVQAGTRMGGLVDKQKPAVKEQMRAQMIERLEPHRRPSGFSIPTPSILVSARKA